MKKNLYALMLGSAFYNGFMAITNGADRYVYAGGLLLVLLVVGALLDYFDRRVKNENT